MGFHTCFSIEEDIVFVLPSDVGLWQIERYKNASENVWSVELFLDKNEKLFHSVLQGNQLLLFSNIADLNTSKAGLFVRKVNLSTGESGAKELIWEKAVSGFKQTKSKALRVVAIDMEIASIKNPESEVPLLYRFEIIPSPSGNYYLLIYFDYSQTRLRADLKILDSDLKLLKEKVLEIDDSNYFYELNISDDGHVYQLNVNSAEDIQLLEFPLQSDGFELLTVTAGNATRDDLKMHFMGGRRVMVICKTEINNSFYGVLYMLMDFNKNEVDRVHFEAMPTEFKAISDSLMQTGKTGLNDWTNYALTHVKTFNDEELLVVLESFDLRRSGYVFKDLNVYSNLEWKSHKSKITSGPAMIFSFDKNDELRWTKFIYKTHDSGTDVFPQASSIHVGSPVNEEIIFLIGSDPNNFKLKMDYIYDSKEVYANLNSLILLPSECFQTTNGLIGIYYSPESKTLIIN